MNQLFIRDVVFDWADVDEDSYLKDIPALYGLDKLEFHQPITFFVGENGSGKSTLLESIAVACGFNGEGGTKNYQFSTYEEEYELSRLIRLGKGAKRQRWGYFLRAENLYNFATQEEAYGGTGGYHYLTITTCTARKVLKGFSDCCSGFKVYLKACYFLVGIYRNIAYISVDKRSVYFLTVNVLFCRFQYGFDFGKLFFHLSLGF